MIISVYDLYNLYSFIYYVNTLFFAFNVAVVINVYYPRVYQRMQQILFIKNILRSWSLVVKMYIIMTKIKIDQYFGKNVERINSETYLVTHIIDGKLTKLLLQRNLDPPTAVISTEDGSDMMHVYKPYVEFEQIMPKLHDMRIVYEK